MTTPDLDEKTISTIGELLNEWYPLRDELDALKTKESALRRQIFELAFKDPKFGTNKARISHGMALIATHKANYRVDRPALETVLQNAGDNERALIDSVISYKPEVRDGAFRALAVEDANIIANFVTQTPGLPTLEVKPQNKVRW